jgi:hypothetical protein
MRRRSLGSLNSSDPRGPSRALSLWLALAAAGAVSCVSCTKPAATPPVDPPQPPPRVIQETPAAEVPGVSVDAETLEKIAENTICPDPAKPCAKTDLHTFEPHELSFNAKVQARRESLDSAPFYAVVLDTRKAESDGGSPTSATGAAGTAGAMGAASTAGAAGAAGAAGSAGAPEAGAAAPAPPPAPTATPPIRPCGGYFDEKERQKAQEMFAGRKVFASRKGCSTSKVNYLGVSIDENILAVYAGETEAEATATLKLAAKTGAFPKARLVKMQVQLLTPN